MTLKSIKAAAQIRGFNYIPFYDSNKIKPEYYDLFNWVKNLDSDSTFLIGHLKEEAFDTIDKKIAYIQGIFEDGFYGYGIKLDENWIQLTHSIDIIEVIKRWINEISRQIGILNGVISDKISLNRTIAHKISLDPEVVKFIKKKKKKI